MAKGCFMPNHGEKIATEKGHRSLLNMQLTDVKNPHRGRHAIARCG